MFIVFDLDDTLSRPQHRLHHILECDEQGVPIHGATRKDADWDTFYASRVDDTPIGEAIAMFHTLARHHHVEVWTASGESHREVTQDWLWHNAGIPRHLLTNMRPAGDHRPAVVLKEGWILARKPDLAFDDHRSVVAMMRRHGVFACAVGDNEY